MKAFQNQHGTVVEIDIDVDPNGVPLLPADTTVDPRPEPLANHYVTVVGNRWVQIEIANTQPAFSFLQQQALERVATYRDWYLDRPVEVAGRTFDADGLARDRLTQALVIFQNLNVLPPAWIDYENRPFPITGIADLKSIIVAVQTAFQSRFFEMVTLREAVAAATTEAELNAITIPSIPMR